MFITSNRVKDIHEHTCALIVLTTPSKLKDDSDSEGAAEDATMEAGPTTGITLFRCC